MELILTALTSQGIRIYTTNNEKGQIDEVTSELSPSIRCISYSPNGQYFAFTNGLEVKLRDNIKKEMKHVILKENCSKLEFSPLSTLLMVLRRTDGELLVEFILCDSGEVVFSYKASSSEKWLPLWTKDEFLVGILAKGSIDFYKNLNFGKKAYQFQQNKLISASLSTSRNGQEYYLVTVCRGQPFTIRVFEAFSPNNREVLSNDINLHGHFESKDTPLVTKALFNVDFFQFMWNQAGSDVLLLTTKDSSGDSYYGSNDLFLITLSNRRDRHSLQVPLKKENLIHSVEWEPYGRNFLVVQGKMPSITTIYNLKCDIIYQFEPAYCNTISFNPTGSVLLISGLGNIQGDINVFDYVNRVKICQIHAPCTTALRWSDDGEYFITATTTPQLRVDNGFRAWHYTGSFLGRVEYPAGEGPPKLTNGEALFEVVFKPFANKAFTKKGVSPITSHSLTYKPWNCHVIKLQSTRNLQNSSESREVVEEINKKSAIVQECLSRINNSVYVPPHLRRKQEDMEDNAAQESAENSKSKPTSYGTYDFRNFDLTGNFEKVKKLKNILKKLQSIEQLKEKQAAGQRLESNQQEKMKTEETLVQEFRRLYT